MIHVCFGLYDKTGCYSKFTGTAMLSIFENTNSKITVHILHDDTLTQDNRDKFVYLAGQYGQYVNFYNVEELCADKISAILQIMPAISKSHFSIATFYRLTIPEIFSRDIDKVIYFDSDIVVNLDIKELWNIELGNKPLGVVVSTSQVDNAHTYPMCRENIVKVADYFNAGVLLMNVQAFRDEQSNIMNGINFISRHPKYNLFDQDVLNYCFAAQALKLPTKFNRFIRNARSDKELLSKKIYHYVEHNPRKSFNLNMSDPFSRLWMHYFMKTPWFDEDTIGRLYEKCQQNYDNLYIGMTNSMRELTALMSGKTRVFVIAQDYLDVVTKHFSVQDEEEIILIDENSSTEKLIAIMNASRGKKVFFIMLSNFPFEVLIQAGFVSGKDFMNAFEFFAGFQGVSLNSYQMIQAM